MLDELNWFVRILLSANEDFELPFNCSGLFDVYDTNDNDWMGLSEWMKFAVQQLPEYYEENDIESPTLKWTQVNCSLCVDNNMTLYYL